MAKTRISGTVGIDPGKFGAIVCLRRNGSISKMFSFRLSGERMESELIEWMRLNHDYLKLCSVWLENVHAMPGQGVVSMFNFGFNFGLIQGVLKSFGVPYNLVTPQAWSKSVCLEYMSTIFPKGSPEIASTKERNGILSRYLWSDEMILPNCRVQDSGLVDAGLIAEYGRIVTQVKEEAEKEFGEDEREEEYQQALKTRSKLESRVIIAKERRRLRLERAAEMVGAAKPEMSNKPKRKRRNPPTEI